MLCREVLGVVLAIALVSSCASEFCTRHSDCPPAAQCGATGVCVGDIVGSIDASDDATTASDASSPGADASENSDAGDVADAMIAGDASTSPDGGIHLLDAGLSPPADAMEPDIGLSDSGPFGGVVVGPAPGSGRENYPHTGSGEVTEELDAGLAP